MERSQIGHVDVVDDQRGNGDHLAGPSGHDGKEHEHHHEDDPKGAEKTIPERTKRNSNHSQSETKKSISPQLLDLNIFYYVFVC